MAQKGEVRIKISARDKASGALGRVAGAVKGLIVAWLGYRGIRAVTGFIKSATQAAMHQEVQIAKLGRQLKNWNQYNKENMDSLTGLAKALSLTTQFSKTQIIAGQAMLGSFALTAEQIKEATTRMLDIAIMTESTTGQMSDLTAVAKLMGMAMDRNAGMLSRAGIVLSDYQRIQLNAAKGMEKFNILMQILDQNAKGLATAVGTTAKGAMSALANQFLETKVAIGKAIIDAKAWQGLMQGLINIMGKVQEYLEKNEQAVTSWANSLAFTVVGLGRIMVDIFLDLQYQITEFTEIMLGLAAGMAMAKPGWQDMAISLQVTAAQAHAAKLSVADLKKKFGELADTLEDEMWKAMGRTHKEFDLTGIAAQETGDKISEKFTPALMDATSRTWSFISGIDLLGLKMGELPHKIEQTVTAWQEFSAYFYENLTKATEELARFGYAFIENVVDSFIEGKQKWNELFVEFMKDITKMIIKMLILAAIKAGLKSAGLGFEAGGAVVRKQMGGYIPGGPPYHDRVPALLSPGEYVIKKEAVDQIGRQQLDRINAGDTFNSDINFNITLGAGGSMEQASEFLEIVRSNFGDIYREAVRRRQL